LGNEKKKKKLPPPQVGRVGTTRTAWTNFKEICDGLNRAPDHVLSYFLSELGTTGVIDGSDRLLLKGKYLPKYIESLILKYVNDFVKCKNCNTVETEMRRDSETRLFFMDCRICGSSRSVGLIKAGFHATGKGERRKARDAAADP
jgi:translation initiation factor 2 subunit 2